MPLGKIIALFIKKFTNFEDSFEQYLVYVVYPAVLDTDKVEKKWSITPGPIGGGCSAYLSGIIMIDSPV